MMAVDMLRLDHSDPQTRRWLDMMKENAERGADLVKQVLTFARGVEGERVQVQLKHIIKELTGVLRETMPKSISLTYKIEPDLAVILADPTQIHQILMNVCINARDAMHAGGTLSIDASNIYIDENLARIILKRRPSTSGIAINDTGT